MLIWINLNEYVQCSTYLPTVYKFIFMFMYIHADVHVHVHVPIRVHGHVFICSCICLWTFTVHVHVFCIHSCQCSCSCSYPCTDSYTWSLTCSYICLCFCSCSCSTQGLDSFQKLSKAKWNEIVRLKKCLKQSKIRFGSNFESEMKRRCSIQKILRQKSFSLSKKKFEGKTKQRSSILKFVN